MKLYLKFFLIVFIINFIPLILFSQCTNVTTINTAICAKTNNQNNYSIETDSKGGAFIVWADNRNNILKADIYAQRINSFGYLLWNSQDVAVCTNYADQANPSTVADGNGGLIIAWDDSINGNRDIYAQKLDSSGNIKWALNGVPVVVKTGKQKDVKIVTDGSGGAIAVWADSNNGYWDIYAQRINSSGVQIWINGGVPICTAVMNQKNPRILSDGLGGAFITWQDKRNGVDYNIYAQHINANGTNLLAVNGILICNAFDKQTDPKIVSDNLGGAIIVWQDRRGGIYYDVYAQRINSAGYVVDN